MRKGFVLSLVLGSSAASAPAMAELISPFVPELEEGAGIIRDKDAAIALGKALFWDEQAGSDGMACASCHFSAGADNRIRNQLSPGFNDASFAASGGDTTFGSTASDTGAIGPGSMPSGARADSNYTLTAEDFPLHQLEDYTNRNSRLITTTNDAVSSQGSYNADFLRIQLLGAPDLCGPADGSVFHAGLFPARQVEPRNTPTVINATFYHANFWDGRANNMFNGVGVFGPRDIAGDPNKRLIVLDDNGVPVLGHLSIRNASLASQAVGPLLSALEMSCAGRTFPEVARRLLFTLPLRRQTVAPTDSVLGPYANPRGPGLRLQHTYAALIQRAFEPRYWEAPGLFTIAAGALRNDPRGFRQIEMNFTMFWGLAIMMYEQTLISDQSRFDTWFASCRPQAANSNTPDFEGGPTALTVPIRNPVVTCLPATDNPNQSLDPTAHGLTAEEVLGFGLFNNSGTGIRNPGNGSCAGCHGPIANPRAATGIVFPVFSEAAYTSGQTNPLTPIERSRADVISEFHDGTQHGVPVIVPTTDQRNGAMHDRGFFNIGVTLSAADPGNGGFDPYGNPLALSRMFLIDEGTGTAGTAIDPPLVITPATLASPVTVARRITLTGDVAINGEYNRCSAPGIIEGGGTPRFLGCANNVGPPTTGYLDASTERELVDGGFKTPSVRNIGLTPPYFHSGNYGDLRSVVEFYARGGSRRSMSLGADDTQRGDSSGTGLLGKGPHVDASRTEHGTNVDFFIRDIKSTEVQIDALVAFMLTVTDERVQCDRAPFDHPSLRIPHGHAESDRFPRDGKADDISVVLPAVGADGFSLESGYCIPNKGDLFAPGMQGRVGGPKPAAADL